MIQSASYFIHRLTHQLKDMETIKDDLCLREIVDDSIEIGKPHIHVNSLDPGSGMAQSLPEFIKTFFCSSLAYIYHSTCLQIVNHCLILVTFLKGELIDRYKLHVFQNRLRIMFSKVFFINVFDRAPAYLEQLAYILHGHKSKQVDNTLAYSMGIAFFSSAYERRSCRISPQSLHCNR